MPTSHFSCQVCNSERLASIDGYAALPRVTSDCKPWPAGGTMTCCENCGAVQKLPDDKWLEEIDRIYRGYQIYELSGGSEQVIFSADGLASPRSRTLVDFVSKNAAFAKEGTLIDIGCGNGAALKNFSSAIPNWKLYGSELSDNALVSLRRLPNFVKLFTKPVIEISERFDVVTMIHALEHMTNPGQLLRDAAGILNDDGALFVEVPNIETSLFDLLVADHLLHFSPTHLGMLANLAGFEISVLRDDLLLKEITMLARRGVATHEAPDPTISRRRVETNIAWLNSLLDKARRAADSAKTFGIFGSSISGMWLYGALRGKVSFFVDEDVTRVGHSFEGVPILSPADVPEGSVVFVPLLPDVARKVAARYSASHAAFISSPEYSI